MPRAVLLLRSHPVSPAASLVASAQQLNPNRQLPCGTNTAVTVQETHLVAANERSQQTNDTIYFMFLFSLSRHHHHDIASA
jgi:hypothetical protein